VKFSIIIPTYNRAHCILTAIDSVIKQDFEDLEIIIIDDCSTDNSYVIVKEFIQIHTFIKLIRLERNCGTNIAKNVGSIHAVGNYLVFLDSDDQFISEDSLKRVEETIIRNHFPKVLMFTCINREGHIKSKNILTDQFVSFKLYFQGKASGEYLPVVERSLFDSVKFHEDIHGGEGLTWISLARQANGIFISSEIIRLYDDKGMDRLSHIDYKQFNRLYKIFVKDLKMNAIYYLRYNLIGMLSVILRIIYYKFRNLVHSLQSTLIKKQ
jgi:teichuronic acid biosynthesis glycosyltransferase TuaG